MSKSIKSLALALIAVFAVSAMPVSAQTSADQVAALLAQIQALQAQLQAMQGGGTTGNTCFALTRSLTVGSSGSDVKALQVYLNANGFTVATSGAGSPGNESTYFGYKTKVAVAKWQAANGVSPASGYFGSISRAKLATLCAGGNVGGGNNQGGGNQGGGTVSATGLLVTLAPSNPAAGSLISSGSSAAARVPVLTLNFTAGSQSAVTVNDIKFTKNGVLSDNSISGAYLMEGGKVITQFSSISSGKIDFASSWTIPAGTTRTITLAIDPATNLSAGNTVSFSLASASDVASVDASGATVNETGTFPINGNTFTVTSVSNPSIATVTITSSTVSNQVYAGSQNVLVSQWSANVSNSPVDLKGLNFRVVGSAAKSDIKNVKLFVNGTQVGPTLSSVDASGNAYFDLTSSPARLRTGNSNIQVYADIMGSPSFTFQFELLNSYDVFAIDTQYNVPVAVTVTGGAGQLVTIQQGQITVTADSGTPTGNIAKGASGVTLAKFDIYAAGEAVRVKFIDVLFTVTGDVATSTVQNIQVVDDAGVQVGSSISTIASGTGSGQCTLAGNNATCHFGTSSSNINYTVPANTTRVLSVKADIISTTSATAIAVSLPGNSSNLQGVTSAQTASSGSATGASLSISSTPLTAVQNTAFGTSTVAKGSTNVRIGSYNLSASAAEGVNIYNLTVTMTASSTSFQNLKAMVGSQQFGTTKSTLSGSDVVTFSGNNLTVPAGSSKTIDVYADVLSSASSGTYAGLTALTSCNGVGSTTNTSVSCPASVTGQNLTVSSGSTVTVSLDSSTAPAKQIVMGSTGNALGSFRVAETSNLENVKVTDITLTDTTASGAPSAFTNVTLTSGGSSATAAASSTGATTYAYAFHFATPVMVPQNGSVVLALTGDVATFSAIGSAGDNKTHAFGLAATTSITAVGASSNSNTTASGTPTANTQTVLRSKLTVSGSALGATTARTRSAVDDIANLVLGATGYDVTVNTITLTFSGQAVSVGSTAFAVNLIDPNTGTDWASGSAQTCTPGAGNTCAVSFTYTGANIQTITAGTTKTLKVRVNSSNFYNSGTTSDSLSVLIRNTGDVNWGDGTTTNGLALEATAVPVVIANISFE